MTAGPPEMRPGWVQEILDRIGELEQAVAHNGEELAKLRSQLKRMKRLRKDLKRLLEHVEVIEEPDERGSETDES